MKPTVGVCLTWIALALACLAFWVLVIRLFIQWIVG